MKPASASAPPAPTKPPSRPPRGRRWRRSKAKTCPHGHPWTKRNTYVSPLGYRNCRRCRYESVQKWIEKDEENRERVRAWDRERKARKRAEEGE